MLHHVSQAEDHVRLNSTLRERLRFLELRHTEADTLLHVHAALLYELQAQLRNLSATVRRVNQNAGCTINVIRAPPPLGMRDTLPPGTRAAVVSLVMSHWQHMFS